MTTVRDLDPTLLLRTCELFFERKLTTQSISDEVAADLRRLHPDFEMSREKVYELIREARRRDLFQIVPPLEFKLRDRLEGLYGAGFHVAHITELDHLAVEAIRKLEVDEPLSLWETLTQRKLLTDDQILSAVAGRFHLPIADLSQLDPAVRDVVLEPVVRKFNVLPVRLTDSTLEVATANPFDMDAEKMLAFVSGREVRMALSAPGRIREKLDELYQREDAVTRLLEGMADEVQVTELRDEAEEEASAEEAAQRPIIRLVDTMLADAVTSRASDIHVEPVEGGVTVRYRIDGVLRQVMRIPRAAGLPLISRIKNMARMDIADRMRPQDGRWTEVKDFQCRHPMGIHG